MKIAVIGGTGRAGSRIVAEAKERGHEVSIISRNENADIKKDLFDLTAEDLKGLDVFISAYGVWSDFSLHLKATKYLDEISKKSGVPWYVVGGAGSLYVSETIQLLNIKDFPKEYFDLANGMKVGLDYLKEQGQSEWSYFSPAADFEPGEKTGKYKLGGEFLLRDENGNSKISMEDYAVAMLDAVEGKKFVRQRFTAIHVE